MIKTLKNFLFHLPNHALKDVYMLNYGIINNMKFFYSSIEVLIDFINFVIALHVSYKQLNF